MASKPIKLTGVSFVVLGLISRLGEATSYDLKRVAEETVNNFWPTPHATLYAEPARLADAGYLSVTEESGGRRRRSYSLTKQGRNALDSWLAGKEVAAPVMHDQALVKLFFGADPTRVVPARREWHVEQIASLREVLAAFRAAGVDAETERVIAYGLAIQVMIVRALDLVATDDLAEVERLADELLSGK